MEDFKIVLDNLEHFINEGLPEVLEQGLTKACLIVEGEAKKKAPARDGQLRQSITHEVDKESSTGYIGSNLEYAPYVEIGTGIYSSEGTGRQDVPWTYKDLKTGKFYKTSGMRPQPYLQPAVEENKDRIRDCFKELL